MWCLKSQHSMMSTLRWSCVSRILSYRLTPRTNTTHKSSYLLRERFLRPLMSSRLLSSNGDSDQTEFKPARSVLNTSSYGAPDDEMHVDDTDVYEADVYEGDDEADDSESDVVYDIHVNSITEIVEDSMQDQYVSGTSKVRNLHLEETEYTLSYKHFTAGAMRSNDASETNHIICRDTAKNVVKMIAGVIDIPNDSALYVDHSAGPGLLSNELLCAGAKHLIMCYNNSKYNESVQSVCDTWVGRAHTYNIDLIVSPDMAADYHEDLSRWSTDRDGKPIHVFNTSLYNKQWTDEPAVRLFVIDCLTEMFTFNQLCLHCLLCHRNVFSLGRVDVFMVVSGVVVDLLRGKMLRESHLLTYKLNMLYDIQVLGEVASAGVCVTGNRSKFKVNAKSLKSCNSGQMFLVRLTTKRDPVGDGSYENYLPVILPAFYLFQEIYSRKHKLIPKIESLLTDSSFEVALLGHGSHAELQDLSSKDLINIIKACRAMPSYKDSLLNSVKYQYNGMVTTEG